ncbi:MAG: type II toxin-antitoxin system HicA family toxin [Phycisphaerales bacterium]|nr:type II toxin-antitoxin system HicA family toxin [Phycisphaerales bacterium]
MSELPQVSGVKAVKAFGKFGFQEARQRGSHVILKKEGYPLLLSEPAHDELKKGTLRKLIRDSGLTVEEFCEQL